MKARYVNMRTAYRWLSKSCGDLVTSSSKLGFEITFADSFVCSLARCIERTVDEWRNVVGVAVISVSTSSLGLSGLLVDEVLEEAILLRADLLQDVREQVLDLLRFRVACND